MSEEMKRIERSKKVELRKEASFSGNLTGEQIFIRSCNTCHSGADAGVVPKLSVIKEKYLDDEALKKLIRKGKGRMPAQPKETLNDTELNNLIEYLRTLN
jgi:mono/diheme cytochrome c family protein